MRLRFGFILLLLVIINSACSFERKLAKEYLKHKENLGAVLVVQPFSLNMYNNNKYNFDSVYLPENFPLDSILFQQTKLLKDLSDSVFLENYLNSFIERMRKKGYQIFLPDDLDAFRALESPAYIFKFAQVELSEEYYPQVIKDENYGTYLSKTFELNLISLSSWFEFEAHDTTWSSVFFSEDAIMDELSGEFIMENFKGKPILYYSIDSLSVDHVYQMATDAGRKYADFLSDYLINSYIKMNFPAGIKPGIFFHYDSDQKMLLPYYEGFEEISLPK